MEAGRWEDRVTTRIWTLNTALAGTVYVPVLRPTNRRRQKIARFLGREGTVERFAITQTMPGSDNEAESPPSQAQYGAVCDFFADVCETRLQAHTLLSARDYAEVVAKRYPFTAPRRRFIWICATAFILADQDIRSRVQSYNINRSGNPPVAIIRHKPFQLVTKFTDRLVDDMRGAGASIFG